MLVAVDLYISSSIPGHMALAQGQELVKYVPTLKRK